MVLFMPWCKLDKTYTVGEIELVPFVPGPTPCIDGLDATAQSCINRILGMYKTIEGRPIEWATLIHFPDKAPTDSISADEFAMAEDLIAIACFAALSQRQYFGVPDIYCNSDCFLLHIRKFTDAKFVAFSSRRRSGQITDFPYSPSEISITVPMHCRCINQVSLDKTFLDALLQARADDDWGRWQNAISCFNQANTDSITFQNQVEWVLLASAFEHFLGAQSNAKDIARRFKNAIQPSEDLLARDADRRSDRWNDATQPLRFEWMREFYRVRGDFAHGKLNKQQPMVWNSLEHLVLATIAFPLVVKNLLQKAGRYEFSDSDKAQIDIFEKFAGTPDFCRPPADQKSSNDTHWSQLYNRRKIEVTMIKGCDKVALAQKLEQKFPDFFCKDDNEANPA